MTRPTYDSLCRATLRLAQALKTQGWKLYNVQPERWSGCATRPQHPRLVLVVWERSEHIAYDGPPHQPNPAGSYFHVEVAGRLLHHGQDLTPATVIESCAPPPAYELTQEHQWLWLQFRTSVPAATIDALCQLGLRWSSTRRAWYATSTKHQEEIESVCLTIPRTWTMRTATAAGPGPSSTTAAAMPNQRTFAAAS